MCMSTGWTIDPVQNPNIVMRVSILKIKREHIIK